MAPERNKKLDAVVGNILKETQNKELAERLKSLFEDIAESLIKTPEEVSSYGEQFKAIAEKYPLLAFKHFHKYEDQDWAEDVMRIANKKIKNLKIILQEKFLDFSEGEIEVDGKNMQIIFGDSAPVKIPLNLDIGSVFRAVYSCGYEPIDLSDELERRSKLTRKKTKEGGKEKLASKEKIFIDNMVEKINKKDWDGVIQEDEKAILGYKLRTMSGLRYVRFHLNPGVVESGILGRVLGDRKSVV